MWCLETIVELNKKAKERYDTNDHPLKAYQDVGCNVPMGRRLFPVRVDDVLDNLSDDPSNNSSGDPPPDK